MNRSRMMLYGNIFDILASEGAGGLGKTALMQRANLTYKKMTSIVVSLKDAGLVSEIENPNFNCSTSKSAIILTTEGIEYKKKLDEFVDFAESFGLSI